MSAFKYRQQSETPRGECYNSIFPLLLLCQFARVWRRWWPQQPRQREQHSPAFDRNILEAGKQAAAARPRAGSWGRAGLKPPGWMWHRGVPSTLRGDAVAPAHSIRVWSSLGSSFQRTNAVCDGGSCGCSALLPIARCSELSLKCHGIASVANILSLDLTTWRCFPSCGIVFPFPDSFPAPCTSLTWL